MRKIRWLIAITCVVIVALALFSRVAFAGGKHVMSQTSTFGPPPSISSTEVTSDGLSMTLVAVHKDGNHWYIHVRITNTAANTVPVWGGDNRRFVVDAPTATDPLSVHILTTALSSQSATYAAALPSAMQAKATSDGWLGVDISQMTAAPKSLIYQYDPFETEACPKTVTPTPNFAGCKVVTLYHVLIWSIK